MKDLVSVIVPVYKVEKYLNRCVNSILNQSYKEIEIILINDGSPDNCPQMCDDLATEYSNIRVIHQKNQGPSIARNLGIETASGKYIAFVDRDDFIHPSYIQFLKSEIEKHNVLISICSYHKTDKNTFYDNENQFKSDSVKINDVQAFELLLENQELCAPWAKLYDSSLFKNIKFPINILYEDMFLAPQVFSKAKELSISWEKLYYYNQEGDSIIRSSYSSQKVQQYYNACEFWSSYASKYYVSLENRARIFYLSNILNLCIQIRVSNDKDVLCLYYEYKRIILKEAYAFFFSRYSRFRDKIKLILLKLNFF